MNNLNQLSNTCLYNSVEAGWYIDNETGEDILLNIRNKQCSPYVFVKLALISTEIREAKKGYYSKEIDTHLPHRSNLEVELADIVIRILDLCGALGINIESIFKLHNEASFNHYHFHNKPDLDKWFLTAYDIVSNATETYRKKKGYQFAADLSMLLIIVFDLNRYFKFNPQTIINEKLAYNAKRSDHKLQNRLKSNGKAF